MDARPSSRIDVIVKRNTRISISIELYSNVRPGIKSIDIIFLLFFLHTLDSTFFSLLITARSGQHVEWVWRESIEHGEVSEVVCPGDEEDDVDGDDED